MFNLNSFYLYLLSDYLQNSSGIKFCQT